MFYPTLEEAKRLSQGHTVVPVAMELYADIRTPIEILRALRGGSEHFFILESVGGGDSWGRYSFLGYSPKLVVTGRDGVVTMRGGAAETRPATDPLSCLREMLAAYRSPRVEGLPPFTGGFVGYFSYDFVKYVVPSLTLNAADTEGYDDFGLMLIDRVIAFDHFRQKIFLIVNVPSHNIESSYIEGVAALKDMERLVLEQAPPDDSGCSRCGAFTPAFSEERYREMAGEVKRYIREGDVFQAVLSNRFTAPFQGSLLQAYRNLRTTNPSPYMVYMHMDDLELACASPETMVTLRDGHLDSFPLAGTRPRGGAEEDAALAEELLADPKELAEHDMLVDLARNDLGKVSEFGTVRVEEYRTIKRFSHVMHIASRVSGRLREGCDALDAVAAALPAGTLSGAPKKRACELIDGLENLRRGPYGGAVGYIDFAGNMDLCIGIRMAVLKNGRVSVQAGAGIVADSDPAAEYRETRSKAQAVLDALGAGREDGR